MKFLHTSDWHVGKTIKGRNRLDEQRAVLGEIVRIARKEAFDAILIAGDLYETSAPSAAAQELVVQALMALRETGAEVLAIAGNHDHAATFEAYRPLLRAAGIQLSGDPRPVADGGVVSFDARSTGERVNVAVLPFLSQRYAVRAAELLAGTPADNVGQYDQRVRDILEHLKSGFTDGAVNLVMAHLTVTGGAMGGGERAAQSIFEYHVAGDGVRRRPALRRTRAPAPAPVAARGLPGALQRRADARRFRRTGQHERRAVGGGDAEHAA